MGIETYIGEIAIIVSIAIFFVKVSMNQSMQDKKINRLLKSDENTSLFQEHIKSDIVHFKEDNARQNKICELHATNLVEVLQKQDKQYTSQEYMRELITSTNSAIANNTAVLQELLIVIRERKA